MGERGKAEGWVYIVVCDPERDEHMLGLYDAEQDVNFIPAFATREAAGDCLLTLPREKGRKYEVQAIHADELTEDAARNGFIVAMVDGDGNIVK